MGTSEPGQPFAPKNGAFYNTLVVYQGDGSKYLYDSEGNYTNLTSLPIDEIREIINDILVDYVTDSDLATVVTDIETELASKQNALVAGANISLSGDTISATDTTYNAFIGTDGVGDGNAGLVPAPTSFDAGKFLNADGNWEAVGNIPTKTSDLTNDGADGDSTYVELDELATVATTGDYDDLLNKPTIPTVNDATLTIQQNGSSVATFTANSNSDATANITVPVITMTSTDPGEGAPLAANNYIAVYDAN